MIREVIDNWNKRKDKLEKYLSNTNQEEYNSYEKLVELLVKIILPEFDYRRIGELSFGEYQGIEIFIIPTTDYADSLEELIYTHNYYGSCCGCDTLQAIQYDYGNYGEGLPTKKQVKEYMSLCLCLIENMKYFKEDEQC
jgi:hypothetical protein